MRLERGMKTLIGIVILGIAVGGIYLLNDLTRSEDGKSLLHVARELEIEVETAAPEQRCITRTVQAPGDVEAVAEVDISSELVSKIIELPVAEGEWVEEGQLLCTARRRRLPRARALSRSQRRPPQGTDRPIQRGPREGPPRLRTRGRAV